MTDQPKPEILIDAPLIPDPDETQELGSRPLTAIADEELTGCRLLLVLKAVESIDADGVAGGALKLACTFHPAPGSRFTSARLNLKLQTPPGAQFLSIAPKAVLDSPVKYTINRKGQLGVKYLTVEASGGADTHQEYEEYHCKVQGSGEGGTYVYWTFNENPVRRNGLGREQILAMTLPVTGKVTATVEVTAVLSKTSGVMEALRNMLLKPESFHKSYSIAVEIPPAPAPGFFSQFLRL